MKLPLECRILRPVHLECRVEPVPDRPVRCSRGRPTVVAEVGQDDDPRRAEVRPRTAGSSRGVGAASHRRGARVAAVSPSPSASRSRGCSSARCSAARSSAAHSILITSSTETGSTLTEVVPFVQQACGDRADGGRGRARLYGGRGA
jgi:hypothetical protein